MKSYLSTLCVLATLLSAAGASAQSYSDQLLSQLNLRNSASRFTSNYVRNSTLNQSIPTYAFSNVNRGILSAVQGSSGPQKPFSSFQRSSGVSPYLGLIGSNPFTSTTDNYFKVVKPQIEAQRQNDQLTAQNIALQKQLGSVASQAPYSPQGATDRAPTGHAAVYFNYGGYYTPVQPHGVRGRR